MRRNPDWRYFDYDKERKCLICRKCGYEARSEDEAILHKREEERVK